jgi:RNA polymerase sigma-70 factor (sigma-E family)
MMENPDMPPPAEPDARVGHVVAEGDGFEAFVRVAGPRLRRSAFLMTGDAHLADDLVQVALAKVAPRWAAVVAGGDPAPYVRRVMFTTAAGWRRRRWQSAEESRAAVPDGACRGVDVDARIELRRALTALTPHQRAVIILRFYDDLTETETAATLRCSVGTVKSQTARALARLRTNPDLPDSRSHS